MLSGKGLHQLMLTIELIGRCLLDVRIGFDFAYPKRAQKLLVDRLQTLLKYHGRSRLQPSTATFLALNFIYFAFYVVLFYLFVWVFVH